MNDDNSNQRDQLQPDVDIDIDVDRDAGLTTVEVLSWSAMMVVAIVAIGGALQLLGVDVINMVRTQIGL